MQKSMNKGTLPSHISFQDKHKKIKVKQRHLKTSQSPLRPKTAKDQFLKDQEEALKHIEDCNSEDL